MVNSIDGGLGWFMTPVAVYVADDELTEMRDDSSGNG